MGPNLNDLLNYLALVGGLGLGLAILPAIVRTMARAARDGELVKPEIIRPRTASTAERIDQLERDLKIGPYSED